MTGWKLFGAIIAVGLIVIAGEALFRAGQVQETAYYAALRGSAP